jgi:DNA-binding transcriptional LysR family regulator
VSAASQLPDLDALRCFLAAARTLNFRAAARAVFLTPAALGQRIRQLEDQAGVKLFARTTRRVALTEAGIALVPHAKRVLERAADCLRAARGDVAPSPIDIVLGTRHELGMSWVLPQLPRLAQRHPHVTIHLYFGSGDDLLTRLVTLEIDCAVTSSRLADPRLDAVRLHREDYVFVGAPALLRRAALRHPRDAEAHTLIDATPDLTLYRYFRDAPGASDKLRFRRVLRMGTIDAIHRLVLQGAGVAVLPEYRVRADLQARRLRPLLPSVRPLADHFRLVFRADDPRRALYEALASSMRGEPLR